MCGTSIAGWEQPEFYNTLTTNCTTAILLHARASGGIAWYNWKILLTGYAPDYAYEISRLDTRLPFVELKRLSHINARAQAAGDAPDFSQRLRAGLPMPPPRQQVSQWRGCMNLTGEIRRSAMQTRLFTFFLMLT